MKLLVQDLRDPTHCRPSPPKLHCSESVQDGAVGSVSFYCSAPPSSISTLTTDLKFNCRKRSIGVLENHEAKVDDKDLETAYETVDPNFFDKGYTLAGATGFQVWAGTRLLLESLLWPLPVEKNSSYSDHPLLTYWQERITRKTGETPLRVLELGAGIGVLGTNLAAAGAQVLLTDLKTLVENATYPNILWNCSRREEYDKDDNWDLLSASVVDPDCPDWLKSCGGMSIGAGWAAATALDWTYPVSEQLRPHQYQNIDLIVASDCVWLLSMLNALLNTISFLFHSSSRPPTFLLSFQRRDTLEGDQSATFTTINRVIQSVHERGWRMECLAWRPVILDQEKHHQQEVDQTNEDKEVFVFSIDPSEKLSFVM